MPRWTILTLLLLPAVGCGGPDAASRVPPPITLPTPNPLDVTVTLDAGRRVQQTVPSGGGTISVTGADGTLYTLSVPADALLEPLEITMTPLERLEGAPITGGTLLGVDLRPHGLRLYSPATLTINPPGGARVEAVAFAAAEGKGFHLYPLALDPEVITLKLMHFSEVGTYLGSENGPSILVDETADFTPADWEAQLEQLLGDLLRKEREAQLRGEPGDPQLQEKLASIMYAYFNAVIGPLLEKIASDCAIAAANTSKVLAWNRNVALLELAGEYDIFADYTAEVSSAVRKGADTCWQQAVGACIDQQDQVQVGEVTTYARLNQLLGGDPELYNPDDPDLQCDTSCAYLQGITTGWVATYGMGYADSDSYSDALETNSGAFEVRADVAVRYDLPDSVDGSRWGSTKNVTGTVKVEATATTTGEGGDTATEAVSRASLVDDGFTYLVFDPEACTFDIDIRVAALARFEFTDFDGHSETDTVSVSPGWLRLQGLPLPASAADFPLTGSQPVPARPQGLGGACQDCFLFVEGTSASDYIYRARDFPDYFGDTVVSWSLSPIAP